MNRSEEMTEELEKQAGRILYPTIVLSNKKGERVFAFKKKKYGYWIFEKHGELMDQETREEFDQAWHLIRDLAFISKIPLYEISELNKKGREAVDRWTEATTKKPPIYKKQVDLEIFVLDHASGKTQKLVIGVSRIEDKGIEKIMKEQDKE